MLVFQVDQGFFSFQAWGGGGGPSEVFCLLENKVVRLSNFTTFEQKKIVLTLLIKLKVIKALTEFDLYTSKFVVNSLIYQYCATHFGINYEKDEKF